MATDIIFLHGLKVDCVIGVWQWEKQIRQTITIDLDMGFDIKPAAQSDNLADTLSYKDVSKRVESFVQESRFGLVEKLAEEIALILFLKLAFYRKSLIHLCLISRVWP